MLSVENLKVEFGVKPLFHDVNFVVNPKERIALVGKNGAGKSTMLKILAGLQQPTDGTVSMPKDMVVGYLPQVMKIADTCTVRQEAEKAFAGIIDLKKRVEHLNNLIAERTDYESPEYAALIEDFTAQSDRLEMMGGDNYAVKVEQSLLGLGFTHADFDRPTKEFSGGWRMRVELAKILLASPQVLLLDEPTNHLDIESIQWLEQFLQRSASAVILVSHDRAFVNNVTTRTIEITCGTINDYRVKYDEYVVLRDERREQQLRAYQNQQKEIADAKEFIERFRYKPTKAVQVQSRIKALEKIVPIEVDEVDNKVMHLKFPAAVRSGNWPVICTDVTKKYGDLTVFHNVSLTIKRGEKVAFVGRNGEGKSTLVKCIMGEIPFEGKLEIGHNIEIGYYAQNQAQLLDDELTVYQTIDNIAAGPIRTRINDILGSFMFGGEASEKKVKVLSGGERSRLAMIRLLLTQANLLILDEPTNHLDMASKDVLKEALLSFDGTVILVSHDREFLDGLADKVFEFSNGQVIEHLGGIYDWLRKKNAQNVADIGKNKAVSQNSQQPAAGKTDTAAGKESYEAKKMADKEKKRLQRAVEECEKRVNSISGQIKELEGWMSTPQGANNQEMFVEYGRLKEQLQKAEQDWEQAMMKLEEFE